jgi:hypothetical protein
MFIEGASPADSLAKTGEESIDLSEYWGGESLENADNVVYRQLKHSSVRTHQPWVASELTSTFEGFARWYFDAVKQHPEVADRIRFEIVTNRPCSNSLKEALDWLRSPSPGSKPNRAVETLRGLTCQHHK